MVFKKVKMVRKIKTHSWRKVEVVVGWTDPKTGEEWTSRLTTRAGLLKQFLMGSWRLEEVTKK